MPNLVLAESSLHYAIGGNGDPPIVFVHGALCTHDDWRLQLDHFAASHRVVAPDLHGHGESSRTAGRIRVETFADELAALIRHLELGPVVLVGHSMGCRVLLQTWKIAPERVAALVFVDGAYLVAGLQGPLSQAERQAMATAASQRAAAAYADVEPAERARHGFAQMFFDPQYAALRDAIVQRAAALPGTVARELMPDFAAWDVLHMEQVLPTVTVPVLAIACTYMNERRERVSLQAGVETPWLAALRRHVPHAEIVRRHGGGHFPMLEQPEATHREITGFLQRHGLHPAA